MPALPAPALLSPQPALSPRQGFDRSVASYYGALYSSPHPGVVAGIVLGCIAGYLLVIWLIYTLLNIGPRVAGGEMSTTASTYLGGSSVITMGTRRSTAGGGGRRRRSGQPVRVRERVEVRTRSSGGAAGRPRPFIVDAEPPESESDVFMGGGRSSVRGARGPRGRRGVRTVSTVSDDDYSEHSDESDDDDEIVVVEESRRGGRGSQYGDRRDSRRRDY